MEKTKEIQWLGNNLSDWTNKLPGSYIICGTGTSLHEYEDFGDNILIGVNDICHILQPDLLVVVDEKRRFTPNRWEAVKTCKAPIFSQLNLLPNIDAKRQVKFEILGRSKPLDLDGPSCNISLTSTFIAVNLAYKLGATKIGMIGVDFNNDHANRTSGQHPLKNRLDTINKDFGVLRNHLNNRGVDFVNLSKYSLVTSLPRVSLDYFNKILI